LDKPVIKPSSQPRIYVLDETESTNSSLKLMASKQNLPNGSALLCFHQTAGRGQQSNHWWDEKGKSLLMSIYLHKLPLAPEYLFHLNIAVSLALHKCVRKHISNEKSLKIKWPNDLYLNNHKLAGILIENQWQGRVHQSAICGFGVNLNQASFPSDLPIATSLAMHSGKPIDVQTFAQALQKEVLEFTTQLGSEKHFLTYQKLMWKLGKSVSVKVEGKQKEGLIEGLNEKGGLLFKTKEGVEAFYQGSIKIVV